MNRSTILVATVLLAGCGSPNAAPGAPSAAAGAAAPDPSGSSSAPPPADADYEKKHDVLLLEEGPPPGKPGTYYVRVVHADSVEKKLIATEQLDAMPSWTPDGKIVFISARSGSQQIWMVDADGTNARQLGALSGTQVPGMPQMATNGLVVFMAPDGSKPEDANVPILVMQQDGSGVRELTRGTQPSLARSGTWITYTYETADPYHREIWRINTDGTGKQQLTFLGDPDYPDANASNISPDETTVAFFSGKESDRGAAGFTQDPSTWGHRNVAVVPANGGARRTITHCKPLQQASKDDCIAADNPAWSPDGKWLVHDTDKEGVWMIDLDGNGSQLFYAQKRGTIRVPLFAN